jgi:hypothetical protein
MAGLNANGSMRRKGPSSALSATPDQAHSCPVNELSKDQLNWTLLGFVCEWARPRLETKNYY